MKNKKLSLYIGIICIILSVFVWGFILLLPQFRLTKTQNITSIGVLVILGELLFWGGGILVGKELFEQYKNKLNPKNWINKNQTKYPIMPQNETINEFNWQPNHLQNNLVKLIPLQETDFEKLYQVAKNPAIWANHPSPTRYQKEEFQSFFDGAVQSKTAFLILEVESQKIIGSTRFYDITSNQSVAIGYTFLATEYWKKGHNRAVKKLMIDYAFGQVSKIIFHVGASNLISQTAVQKLGALKTADLVMETKDQSLPYFEYSLSKNNWKL